MSKARLVITAVFVEGRSQSEVARAYGVSQGWISRLVARFRREGEAAFEPRSRRPLHSPSAVPQAIVELISQLRRDGVGRTHARTPVILLVQDLDIRVVHAVTGELLRALILDPSRSYQPTGRRPGPPPRNPA